MQQLIKLLLIIVFTQYSCQIRQKISCKISTSPQPTQKINNCNNSVEQNKQQYNSLKNQNQCTGYFDISKNNSQLLMEINKKIKHFQATLAKNVDNVKTDDKKIVIDIEYSKCLMEIAKICEELININKKIIDIGEKYTKQYVDMYISIFLRNQNSTNSGNCLDPDECDNDENNEDEENDDDDNDVEDEENNIDN